MREDTRLKSSETLDDGASSWSADFSSFPLGIRLRLGSESNGERARNQSRLAGAGGNKYWCTDDDVISLRNAIEWTRKQARQQEQDGLKEVAAE